MDDIAQAQDLLAQVAIVVLGAVAGAGVVLAAHEVDDLLDGRLVVGVRYPIAAVELGGIEPSVQAQAVDLGIGERH